MSPRDGGWGWGVVVCCPWFPAHDGLADVMTPWVLLVGRCVVGLLFENYIVNASIFIEKQFL